MHISTKVRFVLFSGRLNRKILLDFCIFVFNLLHNYSLSFSHMNHLCLTNKKKNLSFASLQWIAIVLRYFFFFLSSYLVFLCSDSVCFPFCFVSLNTILNLFFSLSVSFSFLFSAIFIWFCCVSVDCYACVYFCFLSVFFNSFVEAYNFVSYM